MNYVFNDKRKLQRHLGRFHAQRPDADNLTKLVGDALNGIAYLDDSQIAETFARNVWGPTAQTVVIVAPLEAMCAPLVASKGPSHNGGHLDKMQTLSREKKWGPF